jgi:hypothetical protein
MRDKSTTTESGAPPVTVKSVSDLLRLFEPAGELSGWRPTDLAFRGQRGSDWKVESTLDRLGIRREKNLLRAFVKQAWSTVGNLDPWTTVVIAQHHGLATRLVDWTTSPLVAAYFATCTDSDTDAAIWVVNWKTVHKQLGLQGLLLQVNDLASIVESNLLDRGYPVRVSPIVQRIAEPSNIFMFFLEPPHIDARVETQMSIMSCSSVVGRDLVSQLGELRLQHAIRKIEIPSRSVEEIRAELDFLGFSEQKMFPGLDGLARSIVRKNRTQRNP